MMKATVDFVAGFLAGYWILTPDEFIDIDVLVWNWQNVSLLDVTAEDYVKALCQTYKTLESYDKLPQTLTVSLIEMLADELGTVMPEGFYK